MVRLIAIALLGLTGAAHPPRTPPPATEAIEYEIGPCLGSCPSFRLRVTSDGEGLFTGLQFTAVRGERRFRVSRAEFAAFTAALAPYRPPAGTARHYYYRQPGCEEYGVEGRDAKLKWQDPAGAGELHHFSGCLGKTNEAMAAAIEKAPGLLRALTPLIGPRPRP